MSTYGALSKARKVRSLSVSKKERSKPKLNPRVNNKREYNNRVILERNAYRGTQGVNINLANVDIGGDEEDDE